MGVGGGIEPNPQENEGNTTKKAADGATTQDREHGGSRDGQRGGAAVPLEDRRGRPATTNLLSASGFAYSEYFIDHCKIFFCTF